MNRTQMIASLSDLCAFFDADEPRSLARRVYKDTFCGAGIEIRTMDGREFHTARDDWSACPESIESFWIGTIIEGDERTLGRTFYLPFAAADLRAYIEQMEEEASQIWHEANDDREEL